MKNGIRWLAAIVCTIVLGCAGALLGGTTVAYAHSYTNVTRIEPTCTQPGKIIYECIYCGESYEEAIPALGHDYHESARTDATYESAGSITYTCSRCGESYEVAIPQLTREETQPAQSGTTTESGLAGTTSEAGSVETTVTGTETAETEMTGLDIAGMPADGTAAADPAATTGTDIAESATGLEAGTAGSVGAEAASRVTTPAEMQATEEAMGTDIAAVTGEKEAASEEAFAGEATDGAVIVADSAGGTNGTVLMDGAGTQQRQITGGGGFNALSAGLLASVTMVCLAGLFYVLSYLPLFRWARKGRKDTWRKLL